SAPDPGLPGYHSGLVMKETRVKSFDEMLAIIEHDVANFPITSIEVSDDTKSMTIGFVLRVENSARRIFARASSLCSTHSNPWTSKHLRGACYRPGRERIAETMLRGVKMKDLPEIFK